MPLAKASRRHLTAQAHTTPSLCSTGRSTAARAAGRRDPCGLPRVSIRRGGVLGISCHPVHSFVVAVPY